MDSILINLKRIEISDDEDDVEEFKTRRLKDQKSKLQNAISRKQEVDNSFDSEGRNHNLFPKNTELKEADCNNSPVSDSERKSLSNPETVYDVVTNKRLCHTISTAEKDDKIKTSTYSHHGDTNFSKQDIEDFDFLGILDDNYLLNLFKEDDQIDEHSIIVASTVIESNDIVVNDDNCPSEIQITRSRNTDINKTEAYGKLSERHEIDDENNIGGTRLNPPRFAKIGITYNEADREEEHNGAYCTCFFF